MGALAVFALSAGFLGATAGITVMDPGYNDHDLYNGETHSIKWLQDGATPTTGQVRIALRNEASTQEVKVIALSAPNNGTYGWKVPMNLARNRYVVRIKLKGQDVYDDGSPFFVNPALRITQPPPGGNLVETKTYSITWTWDGTSAQFNPGDTLQR